jgi:hypothetical protein
MKGVTLTERIKYFHCTDEGGPHGVLVLLGKAQWPTRAVEVLDQSDFRKHYDNFIVAEKMQEELLSPREAVLL